MGLHSLPNQNYVYLTSALVNPPSATVTNVIVAYNADNRIDLTVNETVQSFYQGTSGAKRNVYGFVDSVFMNSENITFADGAAVGTILTETVMVNFGEAVILGNLSVVAAEYVNYGITRGERLTVEGGSTLYARTTDIIYPDLYRVHGRRTGVVTTTEFNLLDEATLVFDGALEAPEVFAVTPL